MTAEPRNADGARVLAGYLFALGAGALWGTTGVLSTKLHHLGAHLSGIGFWRVFLATLGFLAYGLARRELFRVDRRGLLMVAGLGGIGVAVFEVSYQYAIAGVGVAGAATLLYTAPILVAVLARLLLNERLTLVRIGLAVLVLVGIALTVTGKVAPPGAEGGGEGGGVPWALGVAAGLLSGASYAGTTLLARWAVPRYGAVRVLFLELAGGSILLGAFLPAIGQTPTPAGSAAGWLYIVGLGIGSVLLANFFFFAGVRRIEAAPTAIAASIEPVIAALLGLAFLAEGLTAVGWLGLFLVVGGVSVGYWREASEERRAATGAVEVAAGA